MSVLRCCSRSWRSWPVSATRLMGASWRLSPRSIATGCAGSPGARSVAALVAWKLGASSANAHTITTVARRREEFPRCAQGMRQGRLSLDQVGVIAARAGEGSDDHYAQLARSPRSTSCAPRSAWNHDPNPIPAQPHPSITKTSNEKFSYWRIKLGHLDAAKFDAALASHRDALIAQWKHDHANDEGIG